MTAPFDARSWRPPAAHYRAEIEGSDALARLRELDARGTVTLLFAARDPRYAHARVLAELLAEAGDATS